MLLNASHLLEVYGVVGIGVILFLETGVLVGLILPGETLTVLAGAYSRAGSPGGIHFSLGLVIAAAACGAIAGGQLGYAIGRRAGPALFDRRDGRLFRRSQLEATMAYFDRYGRSTILIARFVPFVRTLVSPVAGAARVPISVFASYNALGGSVWAVVVAGAGFLLGGLIPIDRYGLFVTIGIATVSLIPLILHLRAMRRQPSA